MSDSDPVSFGRWQAEHDRLRDQIRDMETRLQMELRELRADFEEFTAGTAAQLSRRRDHQWTLGLVFLTGLALPLAVTAVIVLAGLH